MQLDNPTPLNESVLTAQDEKLKTTEQVLDALRKEAEENGQEWLAENLEISMEAVKERKGGLR